MKILLTGSTGYIGKKLLPVLVELGYEVVCCVRNLDRFNPPESLRNMISVIQVDLLDKKSLDNIPKDIDGAYYLVHSMASSNKYEFLEEQSAVNFRNAINNTGVKHVVYLTGIVNDRNLSQHLLSRKNVENELAKGDYHFTALRAGIIIGAGSASFEIIRDLVEKLPIMIAPKWLKTKCQPIAISDVITFLSRSLFNKRTFDKDFDIGGPDVLSYKEMLLGFAKKRNLRRKIFVVPVMTPRLSSYWLYFVTSTSYKLATSLVDSMKIEVVCRDNFINDIMGITPISYRESLDRVFSIIDNRESGCINVPSFGCFVDKRIMEIDDREFTINKIWNIGGKTGWYYGNWLWKLRGFIDKVLGGVGLREGRINQNSINVGDTLDFWHVLYANKQEGHLLLSADMKLPGEAWLEFRIIDRHLVQTATFRPLGVFGRCYWYMAYPFHVIIFKGMIKKISKER